jgi:hypothetical protein
MVIDYILHVAEDLRISLLGYACLLLYRLTIRLEDSGRL